MPLFIFVHIFSWNAFCNQESFSAEQLGFFENYIRPIKVIIVGAVHIAQYLVSFAKDFNWIKNRHDWGVCPEHKDTPRQFECSKSITGEQVINDIKKLIKKN